MPISKKNRPKFCVLCAKKYASLKKYATAVVTYISYGWGQPSLSVFIGSESDHCLAAGSMSQSCLVDMTDVTLAEKDPHSKVIDVCVPMCQS